jgi:hypothetical protein
MITAGGLYVFFFLPHLKTFHSFKKKLVIFFTSLVKIVPTLVWFPGTT